MTLSSEALQQLGVLVEDLLGGRDERLAQLLALELVCRRLRQHPAEGSTGSRCMLSEPLENLGIQLGAELHHSCHETNPSSSTTGFKILRELS